MVVRSRKTEGRDSRLEKLKVCASLGGGVPMETEASATAVEPLRRLRYITGGSTHRSASEQLERDTYVDDP